MAESPHPQRCLVARWFAFHWITRCVEDTEVPDLLGDGWLNYMRDPFDQDARQRERTDDGA